MTVRGWLAAVLVAIVTLSTEGCALFLVGAGAAGGYAISQDSVTSHFDTSVKRAFRASLAVLDELGDITVQDQEHGLIRGQVQDVNVTITIKPVTKKTVEVTVKARNDLLLPKVDIAQDVHSRIAKRL